MKIIFLEIALFLLALRGFLTVGRDRIGVIRCTYI